MSDKLIYLASPYSHTDMKVCRERFEKICFIAARLLEKGHIIYSPIAHTHPIAIHGGLDHLDSNMWLKFDKTMMDRCDEIWVCKMEGWDTSHGVSTEIDYFYEIGKPIRFIEEDLSDLDGDS